MLQHSVVNNAEIRQLVEEQYGLEVSDVSRMEQGTANCIRVLTSKGAFLLKEFQSDRAPEGLKIEPELTEFLRAQGIPTPSFVPTRSGEILFQHKGRSFNLREFVEGEICKQNTAPEWLIHESADMLGRIHAALLSFPPMPDGMPPGWFRFDAKAKSREYEDLIEIAEQLPPGEPRETILGDLHYKLALVPKLSELDISISRLTRRNTHGDYNISQLVCGPSSILAVIDFSGACVLPSVWEIIRSYTYLAPDSADGSISMPGLVTYVRAYLEHDKLSSYDLQVMPYLYFVQLARSTYGYRQYLITRPANRRKFLEFALWRTRLCAWLQKYAAELSQELDKTFAETPADPEPTE